MTGSLRGFVVVLVLGLLGSLVVPGGARADTAPPDPSLPLTVSADVLPTPQINGVVWKQVVAGNRVYVGGDFTSSRPFGSPAGQNEVPRTHLLAYDIETGELVKDFAPVLNGQVVALALSPDGSTLYVGGSFTQVNGKWRSRLAAFDAATGALKENWRTVAGTTVRSISATASTVYFGGDFTTAADRPGMATVQRPFLAASDAATGAVLPWAPAPDRYVRAVEVTRDGSKVVVGGHFKMIAGQAWYGFAALDPVTALPKPWAAAQSINAYGPDASITSLTSDAGGMLVTVYSYKGMANLEGAARVRESDGGVIWVEDCRGDTYSAFSQGGVTYTVSHAHRCANLPAGGFDERYPRFSVGGVAFTDYPTGVLQRDLSGWVNRAGQPGPTALHFYPDWYFGTFTPSRQGPWNVTGNGKYVVFGGEFIGLNGAKQQGLTRMVRKEWAPNRRGPSSAPELTPTVVSYQAGQARVAWQETHDQDNARLTYRVYRNYTGASDVPVYKVDSDSVWFDRGTLSFVDRGLEPGSTVDYLVVASDPFGNQRASGRATVKVAASSVGNDYGQVVLQDQPDHYYRFSAPATSLLDVGGSDPAVSAAGVTVSDSTAIQDVGDTSGVFDGTLKAFSASPRQSQAPSTFSVEAWVRSTDIDGGRIVGFSAAPQDISSNTDRQLYIDKNGNIAFGVDNAGNKKTVAATRSVDYRDGKWHHVVGTLSSEGMKLYVDGALAAADPGVTEGRRMAGSWRIGRDNLDGWPGAALDGMSGGETPLPVSNGLLSGGVDEVAVYSRALSAEQVATHYRARLGSSGRPENVLPSAAFKVAMDGRKVSFDASESSDPDGVVVSYGWSFGDGGSGSGRVAEWTYAGDGTFPVTLTVTDDRGGVSTVTQDVVLSPAVVLASDSFERSVPLGGWGAADTGGSWSSCRRCMVGSGSGQMVLRPGDSPSTSLPEVSGTSSDVTVRATLDRLPAGSAMEVAVVPRGAGRDGYRARLRVSASGSMTATLQRVVLNVPKNLVSAPVPGVVFKAGSPIMLRVQAVGTSPTTLRFKVWDAASAEPQEWTVQTTDADPTWQKEGSPGFSAFAPSDTSNGPITVSWDNLTVQTAPLTAGTTTK